MEYLLTLIEKAEVLMKLNVSRKEFDLWKRQLLLEIVFNLKNRNVLPI